MKELENNCGYEFLIFSYLINNTCQILSVLHWLSVMMGNNFQFRTSSFGEGDIARCVKVYCIRSDARASLRLKHRGCHLFFGYLPSGHWAVYGVFAYYPLSGARSFLIKTIYFILRLV